MYIDEQVDSQNELWGTVGSQPEILIFARVVLGCQSRKVPLSRLPIFEHAIAPRDFLPLGSPISFGMTPSVVPI